MNPGLGIARQVAPVSRVCWMFIAFNLQTNSTMKTIHRTMAAVGGSCVFLFNIYSTSAQDWPQWRGLNRDGKAAGFSAPEKWPASLNQKWKTAVGTGDATPALVGDKVYVFARQGNEEVLHCLNIVDGKEIWQSKYEAQAVTGAAARHPGPRSTPAVANGKVVVLGVGGVLSCLDASSGKVLWRKDEFPKVVPRFFTSFSPIIVDDMVIAHLGGQGNGALIAFDLASGDAKWKWAAEGPAYASPIVITVEGVKQAVTMTEKSVAGVAVNDGKLLWQIPFAPQGMAYNAATPIFDGQTIYYTGQGRGTKAIKLEKQGDTFAPKELWSNTLTVQYNTPVFKDGFLYGLSDKAFFFCINAKTGETAWTDTVKRGGNFCSILDAGSQLIALPGNSELVVFKSNSKEYTEVAKIKVADTPTYAHPVVSGKNIFIKDQDSLALFLIE